MNDSKKILLSPFFLLSLALLLVNDFYLKAEFHNYLTGKLSDFAGLFAFALFWTAVFPRRKFTVYAFIAAFFVFWKSPLSGGLIELWNRNGLFLVGRTVDATDLVALLVLPVAWIYEAKAAPIRLPAFSQNAALTTIALVSLFAFTATSQGRPTEMEEYGDIYKIDKPLIEILKSLQEYETDEFSETKRGKSNDVSITLDLRETVCDGKPSASFNLSSSGSGSQLKLHYILYECKEKIPGQRDKLKASFEAEVLEFLRNAANQ